MRPHGALLAVVALTSCGDERSEPAPPSPVESAPTEAQTPEPPSEPAFVPGEATLVVHVRRDATDLLGLGGDGKGPLFVAVFAENRAQHPDAERVASEAVPDADLTDGRVVDVTIEHVPTRAEPYHVSAFLDDDANADHAHPAPGVGDTLGMDDLAERTVPRVAVTHPGRVEMDVELGFILPFDP